MTESSKPTDPLKYNLRDWSVTTSDGEEHPVLVTDHWTIINPKWSYDWVRKVIAAERTVGHAICGWETAGGTPCRNHPIPDEKIENIKMVGRCGLHSKPPPPADPAKYDITVIDKPMPLSGHNPTSITLRRMADDIFTRCDKCTYQYKCDKANGSEPCVDEIELFDELMPRIDSEYGLDNVVDQVSALTLVVSIIDYIKTLKYERFKGREDAKDTGELGQRMQLVRLIHQIMKSLAIDRKTRIILRRGDHTYMPQKTLSQLLADTETDIEIRSEIKSMTVKASKPMSVGKTILGIDGKPIIDAEVDMNDE